MSDYLDRYTLTAFPFLVLLLLPKNLVFPVSIFTKIIASLSFLIVAGFSIFATHDLLQWNRARWKTIDYSLNSLKILPHQLDGGFEYNYSRRSGAKSHVFQNEIGWWLDPNEKYILSHSRSCGYDVKFATPYIRILPPRIDSIYLLKNRPIKEFKQIICDVENISTDSKYCLTSDSTFFIKNFKSRSEEKSHSGEYSFVLNNKNRYAFSTTLENIQPCDKIWVSVWRYPEGNNSSLTMKIDAPSVFFHSESNNVLEKEGTGWEKLSTHITIPEGFSDNSFKLFLFNPTEEEIWADDLTITIAKF